MIPILMPSNLTPKEMISDKTNGVGRLSDCIDPEVKWKRNGEFYFSFKYPVNSKLFGHLKVGEIIKAQDSPQDNSLDRYQLFRISELSKPINGIVEYTANHISYDLNKVVMKPFELTEEKIQCVTAFSMIQNAVIGPYDIYQFEFVTNIEKTARIENQKPDTVRNYIANTIFNSFATETTGDFIWNNLTILFWEKAGKDNGVIIRIGKNVTDLTAEYTTGDTYDGIIPYFTATIITKEASEDENGNKTQEETEEYNCTGSPIYFSNREEVPNAIRFKPVEISDYLKNDYGELPKYSSKSDAEAACQKGGNDYVSEHDADGRVRVNYDISLADIRKSSYYPNFSNLESINPYDSVTVYDDRLDINVKVRMISGTWNVLTESWKTIQLGDEKNSISEMVKYLKRSSEKEELERELNDKYDDLDDRVTDIDDKVQDLDEKVNDGIKHEFVTALPSNPDANTIYFVEVKKIPSSTTTTK